MAEGFVLNIPKEMLDRLQKADEKIEKLDKNSRRVGENIRLAFMEGAKGVDKFIGSLNAAQIALDKFKDKKINVGLNLDAKAIDDLKKQLSTAGVNIPVGITGTGGTSGNNVSNIQSMLDSIVKITTNLESTIKNFPFGKNVEAAAYTPYQIETLSKRAKTALYKGELNAITELANKEKERERNQREQNKESQLRHRERLNQIKIEEARNKIKVKAEIDELKRLAKAYKQMPTTINTKQVGNLIAQSKQSENINQRLTSLSNLRNAIKDLDATDRRYQSTLQHLNTEIQRQIGELDKLGVKTKDLAKERAITKYSNLTSERNRLLNDMQKTRGFLADPMADPKMVQEAKKHLRQMAQELHRNKKEMRDIEQKYQNDIASIQIRARQQELQRMRAATEAERNTRKGALQYSQNAKTINEQIKALNYLRTAQKSLDVSTSQGKKQFYELEREIKKTENALRRYGVQLGGVREQSSHLFNISQQLGRALSLMFSVSQIGQYISKMVNVRKEMELQQRSLQVLLQSKDKANELWNQTLDLAVKSPFRVKELVTYTKQLAAYRIESDKLFETNKMLADVSAGLGVDMQRLILAFGQVKSASFLRGCLGKGTPIRLYNDDIKEVQDIVVGDVIMGDDNTPRNVKEVIYGKEQMYIVKQGVCGDDYRVNENHILTLKDKITDTIVDVYVKDYLKDKESYNGVKIGKNNNIIDYPIDVVKDNIDEYFGFVIDGNKRFLLGDGTITHNTELRQFTEAGIPMLEELSKYFEELYGRSVSVAEVFDMISKRMVTFTDVEAVFQRMTSAGGVFFNMQEELSQTTAGMISNLQDSIDLMFNEIGKKNQGIINTAIKWARGLVNNWETVGMVMKGTLVTLLAYQSASGNITNMLYKMRDAASNIAQNFKSGISLHPVSMALTTLAMVIAKVAMEWKRYKDEVKKVEKAHADVIKSVNDIENGFSDLFSNNVNDVEEYKNKLQELVDVAKQKYNIEVKFKVNELDNFSEITQKFDELKAQILILNDLSKQFNVEFVKDKGVKWGWFQDFIREDLTQLGTKQQDIKDVFSGLKSSFSDVFKNFVDVEQLDSSLEDVFNKIDSFGIDVKYDLINKFKDVIGSPLDLEGKAFDEVLKELNINDLTNENKEELEGLVRNFIETERVLKEKKSTIGNLNREIFESFKPQSSDEIDRDYLQRQFDAIKLVYREREKLKKYYIDKGYNTSALKRANEDIKSMYGFELDETFYNDVILPYEKALGEATNELNDFYKANEGYVKNVVSDLNLLGTSAEDMAKEVSVAISSALKNVATEKELSPFVLEEMLAQAEEYYSKALNLELDLMPKIQPVQEKDLEQWQKDLKDKLEKNKDLLQGSIPMVTFQTTQEKALKDAEDAWKATEGLIKRIENAQKQKDNDLASWYSQYNVDELKKKMQVEKDIWTELGGSEDKKGKNTAEERIKEQIRLIKELYQEYQKLSKEYGSSKAKGIVTNSFETLLKEVGLDINNIDFTNLQGVINSLTSLREQAAKAGKEASQELEKAIGETSVELGLILKVKEREDTAKEIENMFSDYEMTIDLKKLDIPQNLAEDLFDVDWTDLDDIKQRLEKERQALEKENETIQEQITNAYQKQVSAETIESLKLQAQGNKARLEDIDKFYQKWNEAERKSTEERLKTYYKYLLNEQHERVKIRLETLRKLQEVEATSKYTDAQKETITNKLKEEEKESLAKQTWKDFETSPMYMQLFDDIENMSKGALEQMIVTMGNLKSELQEMGLPASDLKEILSQINKVEEELERRNPFRNFAENFDIALNRSKELARLEEQRASQQKDYNQVKLEYNSNQDLLATSQDYLSTLEVGSEEYDTQLSYVEILQRRVNELEKRLKGITDSVSETNNQINNINDSSNDFYEQLKNIGSITKSVVDGVFQITDAMSWLPEETQLSLERMKGLSDSAFTIASGIGSIMSGDIIGGITSLISGVSGLVSLFMEWSSGAKEAAIETEKQGRLLTDLQNKYDRLNKAIDEAWNVAQIKQYNAELQKNLQLQIIAQKAIIEAQKSVKGANDYGSEQWLELKEAEEELQKLYDTQEELQKNIYSKLTGGIMDDVLSTTESFVDAWYDAFKETGDGLKGLEDSFNEMLLNLVKRQAAMKIAGRFIDEWDKALERYASEGGLSNSEIEYYANKVKNDLPALSSQLETFFSSFGNVLGDTSGNLSALQRGIQGVTEQQADILASYLNSIKFIVSDSNSQLKALLAAQTSTSASNPIVAQLQVIAQQASAINTLLNSLTAPYQGGAGRAFKVVI